MTNDYKETDLPTILQNIEARFELLEEQVKVHQQEVNCQDRDSKLIQEIEELKQENENRRIQITNQFKLIAKLTESIRNIYDVCNACHLCDGQLCKDDNIYVGECCEDRLNKVLEIARKVIVVC